MTHLSAETRPSATGTGIAGIAAILARPRLVAMGCMVALVASGWAYLLLAAALPSGATGLFDAMCRGLPIAAAGSAQTAAIVGAMWVAMTLAMMLPTAGPMILTYAEIAETAARKGDRIVSPHLLIGGYLAIWFGVSVVATLAQVGVMSLASSPALSRVGIPASALLFVVAGLYQFSALKKACLSACQRPFSFFFLNWTDRPLGVFKLGLRQGVFCLGCCWAMMLLMFAAGAMNAVWMAVLGLVMLIEKMTVSPYVGRAIGVAFTAAGFTILAAWGSGIVS